jgi:superfamily II DNA or RNA helicase
MSLIDKYNSFQQPAVDAIVQDFKNKILGRYLLVIPTGGGKTYTAVKAVCSLFQAGILNPDTDKVLWVAHRNELLVQAQDTFIDYIEKNPDTPLKIEKNIQPMMANANEVSNALRSEETKLVVIDEAHHSAAYSYQTIFECPTIGVLGLTATPSRHDGAALDFEFESFSVGFPDLVKKGLILRPTVHKIAGGEYNIATLSGAEGKKNLEQLNNKNRNNKIIAELISNHEIYKKVIIFVGTIAHVRSLNKEIQDSALKDLYESIDCITGDQFGSMEERKTFIARQKNLKKSIIINVAVLTEGYDDATVNTVVMAAPTTSKLYYMQAAGRAIRMNEKDDQKRAYIIEVEDTLPNIQYKIDNRWLFSDISDALEPTVEDYVFSNEKDFRKIVEGIFEEYDINLEGIEIPEYSESDRYSLILFKEYQGPGKYTSYPLFINRDNRLKVRQTFNYISERMQKFYAKTNSEQVFRMVGLRGVSLEKERQKLVYGAMKNAYEMLFMLAEERHEFVNEGAPWINYVSFRYEAKESELDPEIVDFLSAAINKDILLARLVAHEYDEDDVLIKLPLPLNSCIGKIVSKTEFEPIQKVIELLLQINNEQSHDHYFSVTKIIKETQFPLEIRFANALILIARDNLTYFKKLGN